MAMSASWRSGPGACPIGPSLPGPLPSPSELRPAAALLPATA